MRCGAKCFQVEIETDGKTHCKSVTARTPAEARKSIRKKFGAETRILAVKAERNERTN
ncbi:hypothetical protein V7138_24220 [Bacillus sp. JJ1533]|uniref:hypothetical protein n=1 Tax=Bacillus sp. JJ1533 TaxID=3122959 RepID=UPI0030006915